jgi:calcyphosin
MNKGRIDLILQAYTKLDKNGDGQITIHDLKGRYIYIYINFYISNKSLIIEKLLLGVYDVRKHPKYMNGEWTEEQILKKFLDTFDTKGSEDGVVSIKKYFRIKYILKHYIQKSNR